MAVSRHRKPRPLNRSIKHVRDTSLIIIATEGEHTEPRYFKMDAFRHKKIQVRVLPAINGRSSPRDVLDRLHKEAMEYQYSPSEMGDQFWLVMDRDRWTDEMLYDVIEMCRDREYQIAISNPCFEIWLLLHLRKVEELELEGEELSSNDVKAIFSPALQTFDQGSYDATYADRITQAIEECKILETDSNAPIPDCPGTRVYRLVENLMSNRNP